MKWHTPHLLNCALTATLMTTLSACDSVSSFSQEKLTTPSAETKKDKGFNIEYSKFVLDNGLEVVFHIDRSDPVVSVALTSHVGSAREIPGRTGFAHLFEHLLFLESENLGKGGLDKMSARIGGSGANGSTSRDRTNYFQTVPKDALEKMIWAEADKLGFFINTVTEEVLAKEKQVVKNEKRQSYDNRPYGQTQYVIDKNLYPEGHPYSWQVIGSLEDLQNATLSDVKTFFKQWYVPNNVTLVIAGDFNEQQATTWIKKYFNEIEAGDPLQTVTTQPVKLAKTKKIYFEDNFAKLPELTLTWPTVPQYHPDSYALEVLIELLSDGKKALLNKTLIDEEKLTANVAMYSYQSELAGQLMLKVRGFEGVNLNTIESHIEKSMGKFEQQGINEDDIATIKAGQETSFYRNLSSVLSKGFQLAQYNIFTKDPGFINQDVKNILAVNKADVLRVYQQYLKNKPYVATSFVPKGQVDLALEHSLKAEISEEKIVNGAEQKFDASKQSSYVATPSSFDRTKEPAYGAAATLSVPDVWQKSLMNGMKVYGIENTEVPLVQLDIEIAGSMLFDEPNKIGTANLMAELLNKGTASKTPLQLEQAIKKLGANISIYATKEGIRISASSLARNFQPTFTLLTEMLLTPRWDKNEFDLLKQDINSQIKQQTTSPRQISTNEMNKLVYGDKNRLSHNLLGTTKSLAAIEINDLKAFYQTKLSANLTNIHIVGDIKQESALQAFTQIESTWSDKKLALPTFETVESKPSARLYFYDVPNAKQSQLRIGYRSLKSTDTDFYQAQVMNYILGGGSFASRLTQELRETKGYTYGVRSSFSASPLAGNFMISSGVRSNVTLEASALIKEIVEQYQETFTEQDLATTKSYFLKSNARRFETFNAKLSILRNMSKNNLPANYVLKRAEQVEQQTLESIKGLAKKHLRSDEMIYLVVGDAKSQLERLSALGLGKPILLN
jgi:zinc protease